MGLFPPVHLFVFETMSQLRVTSALQDKNVDIDTHILVKIEEKYT